MRFVNPPAIGQPSGFSHGVVVPPGSRLLYVAGQTAADATGAVASSDFVSQFDAALDKVLQVVAAAGGEPANIARMTIYVTDMAAYRASRRQLGEVWKRRMGRHYPAMALVAVTALVDAGATVEIAADAMLT
jgi:enamine deaminase RidA (YjgF/YER057c/UK114 family)